MSTAEVIAFSVAGVSALGSIATVVYTFANNARSVKNDVISAYEKRVKQLEDDVEEMKAKLTEAVDLLKKREGELETLTKILQGRNPDFETFMSTAMVSMQAAPKHWSRTAQMLESLMMKFDLPIPDRIPA